MPQTSRQPTQKPSSRNILVIGSSPRERADLAVGLAREIDCVVLEADSPGSALKILDENTISILFTPLHIPEKQHGIELLKKINKTHPEVVSVAGIPMDARDSVAEVLQLGVFMHVGYPFDPLESVIVATRGLARRSGTTSDSTPSPTRRRKAEEYHGIIGKSAQMQRLFDLIEKVAADESSTVLIQGDSGTGKELVAQVIHSQSPRHKQSIVPVNCAAIPDELLESELFGYTRGAFTGATQAKMGRIQYADGGTLFLDEIGDMKPSLQAKMLRVIQEKEFEPVGGLKPIPINIRIVAATHRDLEKMVAEGTFRQDLYYRLNVVPITVPPLRDRTEDLPLLIEKFIVLFNRNKKKPLLGFEPDVIRALAGYDWPGNVRELENLVQHMSILHGGEMVTCECLPEKYLAGLEITPPERRPQPSLPAQESEWAEGAIDFNTLINEFENRLIRTALIRARGNKKEAARLLNLKRTTLLEKIKKKDINTDDLI